MGKIKGWVALDIDGTITESRDDVPKETVTFLRELHEDGWGIALATGRSFSFALTALSAFDFPYILLAQNGSVALEMPSKLLLFKKYLSPQKLVMIEEAFVGIDSDFVAYSGYNNKDMCFWRPSKFLKNNLSHLSDLQKRQHESWEAVDFFPLTDSFPLVKCFGTEGEVDQIAKYLKATDLFQVAKIRDPFADDYFLLLITDRDASKGNSLRELFQLKGRGKRVIAAGDDENDESLLAVADVKIAMEGSPQTLLQMADFIAARPNKNGIIEALRWAIQS